ncbi:MAG: hydroxymethylglutaryl-CoA reductase, degradative [Bdellovibrionaceae bacterium]|jgi:hydroxymethylglutaryl-CoA reductase|nr:hydroxymethylglutaryl-CoA reductase, degradative [Pseudobdellovibrionaceae bacterium]
MGVEEELLELHKSLFQGFSKLSKEERFERLKSMGALSSEDVQFLSKEGNTSFSLAEKFIENVIGFYQMPMGVAANFVIDGKPYVIPMAVEETSIIAAASKTAKWVRDNGSITTESVGKNIIGQIQIPRVKNFENLKDQLATHKQEFIDEVNQVVAMGLVRRGGGVKDITLRHVERGDGDAMAVIHVYADPCEAMGANIMNQVVEYLKFPIEGISGEEVGICILSNLVDTKVTRAKVVLNNIDEDLAEKIEEASLFSQVDPYRAATNNKGVLNGIDPILIATGNDWRAVEAGVHSYAAKNGQYSSVTRWKKVGKQLIGEFEAPIIVGVVGGVTKLHPAAQLGLKMLGVDSAEELSRICAAVGLIQNLGAIKALATVGIIEGHMKLHIKNLTLGAGAMEKEIPLVQKKLEEILALRKRISLSNAIDVLKEIRDQASGSILTHKEN